MSAPRKRAVPGAPSTKRSALCPTGGGTQAAAVGTGATSAAATAPASPPRAAQTPAPPLLPAATSLPCRGTAGGLAHTSGLSSCSPFLISEALQAFLLYLELKFLDKESPRSPSPRRWHACGWQAAQARAPGERCRRDAASPAHCPPGPGFRPLRSPWAKQRLVAPVQGSGRKQRREGQGTRKAGLRMPPNPSWARAQVHGAGGRGFQRATHSSLAGSFDAKVTFPPQPPAAV